MKVGFGRAFKSLEMDYLLYADIWSLVASTRPTGTMPSGAGSLADPYRPLGIGDWFWLSQQSIGEKSIFIKVADRLIAKWGTGGDQDATELANTIAGLLISEGGADRDKSGGGVFMSAFMLLDLIEKQINYGRQGQYYTWASMLMHAGKDKDQPAPDEIPGRSKKTAERKLAKHPMAGFGTVAMGSTVGQNAQNEVRNRIVSIATAWIANYLAEHDIEGDYKYVYIRTEDRNVTPKSKTLVKSYDHLKNMAFGALRTRGVCTACLLTGSKTKEIGYLDKSVQIWK